MRSFDRFMDAVLVLILITIVLVCAYGILTHKTARQKYYECIVSEVLTQEQCIELILDEAD